MRRLPSATFIAALAAVAAFCLVGVASAAASMVQVDRFGSAGTLNGQFRDPTAVAVNESNGDVYVIETSNRRVSQFDASGRFLRAWGWDVDGGDPGTGFEICPAMGACKAGVFGSGAGQVGQGGGIAVNPVSGDVYIADLGSNNRVQQFDASGHFIRAWGWDVDATTPGTGFEVCPAGDTCKAGVAGGGDGQFALNSNGRIAVDPATGDVFVADPGNGRIQKFDASGSFLGKVGSQGSEPGQFPANAPYYVALDSAGNLYAGGGAGATIVKFDSSGSFVSEFGAPPLAGATTAGLAVDRADDHLFVARTLAGEGVVQEFDSAGLPLDVHGVGERLKGVQALAATSSPPRVFASSSQGYVSVLGNASPEAITGGAAPRTGTEARLAGWVDPNGSAATYYFEYGPNTNYGTSLPASQDADAGAGASPVAVWRQISGLRLGTTYHFRLVVKYAGGTIYGPDRAFTTRTAAELSPPARGIELVSNPGKGNQNVSTPFANALSADGSEAFWMVAGGAPGGTAGAYSLFLANRGASGWSSTGLIPPAAEQYGKGNYHYKLIGTSESRREFLFFVDQGILSPAPYAIVRVDRDGGTQILGEFPAENVDLAMQQVDGNRADYSHVIYQDPSDHLLYDYGSGSPVLVSVMPDGSTPACGIAGSIGWHPNQNEWISADGSRVFFITAGNDCTTEPQLYVRNLVTGTTTLAAGPPDHGPVRETIFVKASADAKRAIFLSNTALVAADENSNWDIYRYTEGAPMACLTCGIRDAQVKLYSTLEAEAPVAVSDDLSRVYFLSDAQLRPGALPGGRTSLYVWQGGEVRFVAAAEIRGETWSLSDDGTRLAFESENGDLTADETGNTKQIYLYDDVNRSLECVSCSRSGPSTVEVGESYTAMSWRQMSSDGSTVTFATMARLVPDDVNGNDDVYEWRNGILRLVTDGETKFPVGYASALPRGIDADGSSILFSAGAKLTGFEQESTANLYAARFGGGFTPPRPPQSCIEDSCQGPLQAPPALPGAASAGVDGGGNVREKAAARKHKKKPRKHAKKRAHVRKKGHAKKRAGTKHGVARNG